MKKFIVLKKTVTEIIYHCKNRQREAEQELDGQTYTFLAGCISSYENVLETINEMDVIDIELNEN